MTRFNRKTLKVIVPVLLLVLLITYIVLTMVSLNLPQSIYAKPGYKFSVGGQGAQALNHPLDVAVAGNGQIFISDSGSNRIQVFSSGGKFNFAFGNSGTGDGQFNTPYGIAFTANGSVLVSDMLNYRIQHFDQHGKFLGYLLKKDQGIKPGMLLVLGQEVYVADLLSQQIAVVNQAGQVIRKIYGNMNFPQGLAKLGDKLLVADAGNSVIKTFSAQGADSGKPFASISNFQVLRGLAVDNLQRVLAVDSMPCQVKFMSGNGQVLFNIGSAGSGREQFKYPAGIAIDRNGRIYIADWGNNRIQVWGY